MKDCLRSDFEIFRETCNSLADAEYRSFLPHTDWCLDIRRFLQQCGRNNPHGPSNIRHGMRNPSWLKQRKVSDNVLNWDYSHSRARPGWCVSSSTASQVPLPHSHGLVAKTVQILWHQFELKGQTGSMGSNQNARLHA